MGMDGAGLSVADALALGREDNDGMFGGSGMMAIFFLFFILAFGGNGFNGNNGALTRGEMQAGFDNQTAQMHVQAMQTGMYQGFYDINRQLDANRFSAQQCCCETNRNIDSLKYEAGRNACDIITAGNANTQRIIDVMTQNSMQELRDRLQTAELELSNRVQTANIIEAVRPFPTPAYVTCSPYTSNNCGSNCAYAY